MSRVLFVGLALVLACGDNGTEATVQAGNDAGSTDTMSAEDTVSADTVAPTEDSDAPVPDTSPDTVEPPADADPPAPAWDWTWLDCRRAFEAGTLAGTDLERCTEQYTQAPPTHRFGIHWVFLGHDEETMETYPETQMQDLNDIYTDNQMSFFIHSRERIVDPVAVEGAQGETQHLVSELIGDIRQYLDTDETDPQAVLDLFLAALEAQGVGLASKGESGTALDPKLGAVETTLDSEWSAKELHQRVARLHNDVITVVVRQAQGEKSWGNFPQAGTTAPTAGLVYLSTPTLLSALPHEIGHYFGLPHTHGLWNRKPGSTQAWQVGSINSYTDADWTGLQALAGEDYSNDFKDSYLPFDTPAEAVTAFEEAQLMGRRVLAWAALTYVGDFEPVANDAEFIALIRAGTPPFMKNFVRENEDGSFFGNNCGKSYTGEDQKTLRCKYGDDGDQPEYTLFGDASVLLNTLLFVDSTESNMMSYISTDTSDGIRRKRHLTPRQRDLIRLGTRMPSRLRLHNYALDAGSD